MKLDSVGEIFKVLIPFFKARTVFYISLILMVAFWIAFMFPEVLDFFRLDTWLVTNEILLSLGTIISTLFFVLVVFVNLDSWISQKRIQKRQERQEQSKYKNLSSEELLYLFQFIHHRSTIVEFDSTDPIVGLLASKGLIYQSMSVAFPHTSTPRFRWNYDYSKVYEISPEIYQYLNENRRELFNGQIQKAVDSR